MLGNQKRSIAIKTYKKPDFATKRVGLANAGVPDAELVRIASNHPMFRIQ